MKKILIILFLGIFVAYQPLGAVETSSPQNVVKKLLDTIKAIKDETKPLAKKEAARNKELKEEANSLVHIQWLSRWTLGKYWEKRTEKERKDFQEIFGNIFKNVAYPKTGNFFRELEITYDEEKIKKEKAVVVTTINHEKEGEIEIEYKLKLFDGRWMVYDVVMDGVSLGRNLKTKFQKIIKDNSYAELTRRMEKKLIEKDVPKDLM